MDIYIYFLINFQILYVICLLLFLVQNSSILSGDCDDLLKSGETVSGVYVINLDPDGTEPDLRQVYCDMDTDGGGWTVSLYNKFDIPIHFSLAVCEWARACVYVLVGTCAFIECTVLVCYGYFCIHDSINR